VSIGGTPIRYKWRGSHIAVTWSPDGKYLMTATQERELHGWRLADGSEIRMGGYPTKVRSFDWLAKPPFLVTAGADCVTGWSFAGRGPAGREPFEVGRRPGILVTCVAAHPRHPVCAFGYEDGEVSIAEVPGGRLIPVRRGDGGRITTLAWASDGAALAAGTTEGAVSLVERPRGQPW